MKITLKYILITACPLLALLCACAGLSRPETYRHIEKLSGNSGTSQLSDRQIARDSTYQAYFILEKPEKCLKFVVQAHVKTGTLKEPVVREVTTYYIVERSVDVSHFKADKSTSYYEMGRNFDLRWNSSHLIVLCGDRTDPFKNFEPGLYRIRFSSLRAPEFDYTIEIHSNNGKVTFGM